VAARARSVHIDERALAACASTLRGEAVPQALDAQTHVLDGPRERRAAFLLCLDAVNFGSGWWPTIRKRASRSGYFTIAAALAEHFRRARGFTAFELRELSPRRIADVLGQDPMHPLMADYASVLRDVGMHVAAEHAGSFASVIDSAQGSAVALAEQLARWRGFADSSRYDGSEIPFFKRAQITAADAEAAGLAAFADRSRLTAFADNLVPHVLRVDGVLVLDEGLRGRIEASELLEHGSPEEVELRACAVHAVELLASANSRRLAPADIDNALWHRGQAVRYKELPRPRSRTTAY
jgi:Queuosine salvage protein